MKRTQHITLGLLAGMALAFTTGCNRQAERRDCVDAANRLANDQACQDADQQRRRGGYIGPYYHYLYGGSSGGRIGDTVVNGNPSPGMGRSGGIFGGISRGGFGSTASGGHGGSGGE